MLKRLTTYIFVKNLSGKVLTDEKIHDFKRLLVVQIAILLSLFILDLFTHLQFPMYLELSETLFFAALGTYVFLLWDMLRNYTTSKRIILINFFFINGVFLIGFIAVNPFFPMEPTVPYRLVLAAVQLCLLSVESTIIYFTLMEFFRKDLGMNIRLWGAANIYLMIGLAFGSVYELISIVDLNALGIDLPLRTEGFMKRCEFSLMVLSGMNTPYSDLAPMMYSLGTVEALFGQLFVVLIVGRLLMK
jgi:hypothetical protein